MTETDATAVPRETGQEKATATCPNCGGTVGVIESPYGSFSAAACPKCYPQVDPNADANARQQASSPVPPRETGTQVSLPNVPPVPGGNVPEGDA